MKWGELDKKQQHAFELLTSMLTEAVKGADADKKQKEQPLPWWLQSQKTSNMAFLSGKRGSGKTTVFTSLVEATAADANSFELGDAPRELKDQISKLRNRIVWLEPLDLEPSPASLNIVASLLARISDAAAHYRPQPDKGRDSTLTNRRLQADPHQRAFEHLTRLEMNVALGWDMRDRLPLSKTTEGFASEVLQTEKSRLSTSRDLSNVLTQLAPYFQEVSHLQSPIFVFTIDDFDLAPKLCLPLLRMLRQIWVPRLFFLLIGDLEIAEFLVRLGIAHDFANVVDVQLRQTSTELFGQDVFSKGEQVAGAVCRKLVPIGQVAVIEAMTFDEALKYSGESSEGQKRRTLEDLLAKYTIPDAPALGSTSNLHAMLFEQPKWADDAAIEGSLPADKAADKERIWSPSDPEWYSGSKLLQTAPRWIADLWIEFEKAESKHSGDQALETAIAIIARHCQTLIDTDPFIRLSPKLKILNEIRPRPSDGRWQLGNPLLGARLFPRSSRVRATKDPKISFPASNLSKIVQVGLEVGQNSTWAIESEWDSSESSGLVGQSTGVAVDTTGSIITLHDLLVLRDGSDFDSPFLGVGTDPTRVVAVRWGSRRSALKVFWLSPPFDTFWKFDEFTTIWDGIVDQLPNQGTSFLPFAYAWISLGTACLDPNTSPNHSALRDFLKSKAWSRIDWEGQWARISKLGDPLTGRWVSRIVAMLTEKQFAIIDELRGELPEDLPREHIPVIQTLEPTVRDFRDHDSTEGANSKKSEFRIDWERVDIFSKRAIEHLSPEDRKYFKQARTANT